MEKTTTVKKTTTPKKVAEKPNNEITQVMEMMKQMQEQMAILAKENAELKSAKVEVAEVKPTPVKSNRLENIDPNELIDVQSLIDHELNISTKGNGQGENYTFRRYGEVQSIIYSDLQRIISSCKSFFEKDICVILDERVNTRHQLKKYSDIVSEEIINQIVQLEGKDVDKMFSQLSDHQKDNVVDMIVKNAWEANKNRTEDDDIVDINYTVLRKMSKHYRRSLIELIEESLEIQEDEKNNYARYDEK